MLQNKRLIAGISCIMLLSFILALGGCDLLADEEEDKGALGGTTWTRTASYGTAATTGFSLTWDLTFKNAKDASIRRYGWTSLYGDRTNVNETTNYTYIYLTDDRKGALTSESGSESIFSISADGNTLTETTYTNTLVFRRK